MPYLLPPFTTFTIIIPWGIRNCNHNSHVFFGNCRYKQTNFSISGDLFPCFSNFSGNPLLSFCIVPLLYLRLRNDGGCAMINVQCTFIRRFFAARSFWTAIGHENIFFILYAAYIRTLYLIYLAASGPHLDKRQTQNFPSVAIYSAWSYIRTLISIILRGRY